MSGARYKSASDAFQLAAPSDDASPFVFVSEAAEAAEAADD